MPPRFFTVEQANRLLPDLIELLERLLASRNDLERLRGVQEALVAKAKSNGHNRADEIAAVRSEMDRAVAAGKDLMQQIQSLGVLVKDIDQGLVDFPCIHAGRRVLLCWRMGEPAVEYWHEFDTGFASRQPIRPATPEE